MSRKWGLEHEAVQPSCLNRHRVFLALPMCELRACRACHETHEPFLRKRGAASAVEGVFQRKSPAPRARQGLESKVFDSHLFCDPPLDVFAALTFFWGEVTRQGQRRTQCAACGTPSTAKS